MDVFVYARTQHAASLRFCRRLAKVFVGAQFIAPALAKLTYSFGRILDIAGMQSGNEIRKGEAFAT